MAIFGSAESATSSNENVMVSILVEIVSSPSRVRPGLAKVDRNSPVCEMTAARLRT